MGASASGGWGGNLRAAAVALEPRGAVGVQHDDDVVGEQQRLDASAQAAQA
jgi:hypothetical protein